MTTHNVDTVHNMTVRNYWKVVVTQVESTLYNLMTWIHLRYVVSYNNIIKQTNTHIPTDYRTPCACAKVNYGSQQYY